MRIIIRTILLTLIMSFMFCASALCSEYIAFGKYPKNEVSADDDIINASYDINNDAQISQDKYRRVPDGSGGYKYFKYESLYWEAINTDEGILLVSKDIIDSRKYDEQEDKYVEFGGGLKYASAVTWEDSSIRNFLNSDFYNTAFSSEEKDSIMTVDQDSVSLVSAAQAESMDTSSLKKKCTDYALAFGAETYTGIYSDNNGSWLLKDISPILSSAVCHISYDGSIQQGMTVLVSDPGYGIVPCIKVSSLQGLNSYTDNTTDNIYLYAPSGEIIKTTPDQKDTYLNQGWYETQTEAQKHTGSLVNENFRSLSLYGTYAPFVTRYATEYSNRIYLECADTNLTKTDIIKFLYPLVKEALTGDPSDYMEISVEFKYDSSCASSLEDFNERYAEDILHCIYTCWSNWGGIINTGDSTYGYDNSNYNITVNLIINCAVNDYYNKLNEIASAAKAYSSKPLGQIQYIRNYLSENVHYDSKVVSNNPDRLLLHGEGVCGNYANAVNDLCFMLDIPSFVVSNSECNHARNCLFIEGAWHEIDTTGISSSDYSVNDSYREFTPGTFTDSEATADNVSFFDKDLAYFPLKYGTNPGDDVNASDFEIIKSIFQDGFSLSDFKNRFKIPDTSSDTFKIFVNNSLIFETNDPYIENGRILVPMRTIFESLDAVISWEPSTKTAIAVKDNINITISLGNSIMYVSGSPVSLDTPPKAVNGQTLVPVRAVSEAFNASVNWDSATKTITIYG